MEPGRVLASPQSIIWEHVASLQEIIEEFDIVTDEKSHKRKAALSLHLSVLTVESFLNIYFRLLVEENKYKGYKKSLLKDIQDRRSLDYKIRNWPKQLFGKPLDFTSGALKQFMAMKEMRNSIMHYEYTWESVTAGDIEINGLTDISFYASSEEFVGGFR